MTTKTNKTPVYTDSIKNAPKDGSSVVVVNPVDMMYVYASWDATWGGGRGAWFRDNGTVIKPSLWNPATTQLLFPR